MFLPEGKGEADKKKKRHCHDVLPLYIKVVISCRSALFNSMNILVPSDKRPVLGYTYLIGYTAVVIKLQHTHCKVFVSLSVWVIFNFK